MGTSSITGGFEPKKIPPDAPEGIKPPTDDQIGHLKKIKEPIDIHPNNKK